MLADSRPRALLRVLRASAAAAALFPLHEARAHADDRAPMSFGVGLFFGYQFSDGSPKRGFEWGLEAFATRRLHGLGECTSVPRTGLGPLVQLGLIGLHDPRITVAAQGGGELGRGFLALSGELGLTYRFGSDPGFGLHLGVVPELAIFNLAIRYEAFRDEGFAGGGVRYLPTYGSPGMCAEGRPLRSERGDCLVHEVGERATAFGLDLSELAAAGPAQLAAAGFARDAQLECDSVASFLQLALELYAVGAPAALIEAAARAAHDEIRHTRQCTALAAAVAPQPLSPVVRPVLPAFTARPAASLEAALIRLATESWHDGCLAEACAARRAAHAAESSVDRATAGTLRAIARDEAGHRELAWHVLDFCLERGGEVVREALRAEAEMPPAREPDERLHPDGLESYGRLSAQTSVRLAREQRRISQRRLAERGV